MWHKWERLGDGQSGFGTSTLGYFNGYKFIFNERRGERDDECELLVVASGRRARYERSCGSWIVDDDLSDATTFYPPTPTTLAESLAMQKLSQIWQTLPNARTIGGTDRATTPSRRQLASMLHSYIDQSIALLVYRYTQYRTNPYYMSLAISKDIYESLKTSNTAIPVTPRLDLSALRQDENSRSGGLSRSSTSTCDSNSGCHSVKVTSCRLAEGATFAEITNKLNGCRHETRTLY